MTNSAPRTWAVGHDGSAGASIAATWAITQAADRHVQLRIVRSWQVPAINFPMSVRSIEEFAPVKACWDFDDIVDRTSGLGIPVSQSIVCGLATQTLLDESKDASLVVLGSRGHGGFRRLLLGSVSSQCATHAQVPTVVVPAEADAGRPITRIVVGVDGSERSLRALAWATEFAPAECEIAVVGAWMLSKSGHIAVTQRYTHELDDARGHFNSILDAREEEAGETLFERRFAFADPAATLLDEAARADLLVVGQRGHSGLSAAILGSVSTHVLHHSPIPVAVVPDID